MSDLERTTIGGDISAYEQALARQAEDEERYLDRLAQESPLGFYALLLDQCPHPPQECGDPSSCIAHAADWYTHQGCGCTWYSAQRSAEPAIVDEHCPAHGRKP